MSGGQFKVPDRLPRRQRHRPPARRDAQPSHGIDLRPHPRPDRRRPEHAGRRQGLAQERHPLRRPGDLPRIEKMLERQRRSAATRNSRCRSASPTSSARARTSRSSATAARCSASSARRSRHWSNDHGIDVELIDLRTLRPLDTETIVNSIKKTNRCVIVDEDWGYCGMGAGILVQDPEAGLRRPRRPDRIRPQRRDPRAVQPLPRRSDDAQRRSDRRSREGSLLPIRSQRMKAEG